MAIPGSEEKIALLALRVATGQRLWHPLDRTAFDVANFDNGDD